MMTSVSGREGVNLVGRGNRKNSASRVEMWSSRRNLCQLYRYQNRLTVAVATYEVEMLRS